MIYRFAGPVIRPSAVWRRYSTQVVGDSTLKKLLQSNAHVGKEVTVNGWVRSVRKLKNVAFADVADGTTEKSLMVVMKPDQGKLLSTGACISITGSLEPSKGKGQDLELVASEGETAINVLGESSPEYPFQKKYHSPEFLRSIPQFRWKGARNSSVLRYRSYAQSQFAKYFEQNDYTMVNSPIVTSSDCEGAGETFSINPPQFFGEKGANLTVSSQLHLEVFAASLTRVWNMAPAFRAEESDTNRHLSEFWMVEAELAFTRSLEDVLAVAEGMIRAANPLGNERAMNNILSSIRDEEKRNVVKARWESLVNNGEPWARITYTEAVKLIQESGEKLKPIEWGQDLASEHEKYLAGKVFKGPVFVTDYPKSIKPFYMKPSGDGTVACFDLLVPELGELIGGSLREDNYDNLLQAMKDADMNIQDLDWYLDLRKFGSFPHGGFGMGFERFVCYICGVENIRDAIGFPRWAGSCVC
uniref:asparagine--tRNA ligase n=1 Tax=Blastobotrys adeninivorans TaxID=409370 RepID=A0A060SZ00_BLAAD